MAKYGPMLWSDMLIGYVKNIISLIYELWERYAWPKFKTHSELDSLLNLPKFMVLCDDCKGSPYIDMIEGIFKQSSKANSILVH